MTDQLTVQARQMFVKALQEALQELTNEKDQYPPDADIQLILSAKLRRRGISVDGLSLFEILDKGERDA